MSPCENFVNRLFTSFNDIADGQAADRPGQRRWNKRMRQDRTSYSGRCRRAPDGDHHRALYDAAVRCVAQLGHVRAFELADAAGIEWTLATRFLVRMEQDGIVGPMNARGWRQALGVQPPPKASVPEAPQLQASQDRRFDAVRRMVARELHPDHGPVTDAERVLKTKLFQLIWPQIQALSVADAGACVSA